MKFSPTVFSPCWLEFLELFHQVARARGLIVFSLIVTVVGSSFIVVVVFVVSSVWRIIVVRGRILSLVAIVVVVVVWQLGLSEGVAALQSCKNIFQKKSCFVNGLQMIAGFGEIYRVCRVAKIFPRQKMVLGWFC